ncbi:MAG TPA: proteasome subunit alpha [Actinomycetota bacterium]|nr:proteasome subunit alpha [Actinomycetota bacterium]
MPGSFMYASPEQVMRDKADYARKGIARGKPLVAMEYSDGVLFLAENPSSTLHKISEIYDRIAFAGVGKYNEYENLRIAGIRQADLKGFSYSREDVSARSLASQYSQWLGQIFTEAIKPFEVEILLAQVNEDGRPAELYHVMYDGIMADATGYVALGGKSDELTEELSRTYEPTPDLSAAVRTGLAALQTVEGHDIPSETVEAAVLDRTMARRKFRRLSAADLTA